MPHQQRGLSDGASDQAASSQEKRSARAWRKLADESLKSNPSLRSTVVAFALKANNLPGVVLQPGHFFSRIVLPRTDLSTAQYQYLPRRLEISPNPDLLYISNSNFVAGLIICLARLWQPSIPCCSNNACTVTVGPLTHTALWLISVSTGPWSDSRASAFSSFVKSPRLSIHDAEVEARFRLAHRWSAGNVAPAFCRGGF